MFGYSPSDEDFGLGTGVWGESPDYGVFGGGSLGVTGVGSAAGVYGYGDYGVVGESASTFAGVLALGQSPTDVALEVQGKLKFSRSGRATLGAGKSSIKVTLAGYDDGQPGLRRPPQQPHRPLGPVGGPDHGLIHHLPERDGDVIDVHRLVRDQLRWQING